MRPNPLNKVQDYCSWSFVGRVGVGVWKIWCKGLRNNDGFRAKEPRGGQRWEDGSPLTTGGDDGGGEDGWSMTGMTEEAKRDPR